MHIRWITRGAAAVLLAAVVVPGSLRAERPMAAPIAIADQGNEDALVKKAHAIHDKVIALDTHNDISPTDFTAERNYTQRLDTQVNLPKMVEGGLDASFFVVYVGQGPAYSRRLRERLQASEREIRRDPSVHRADRARQDSTCADVR